MPVTTGFDHKKQEPGNVRDAEVANRRDPMKFKNGDVSLDDAIKHNGGRLVMATLPGRSVFAGMEAKNA
jgi:hypothetical protein